MKITRDKRLVGRRVRVCNPRSKLFGRLGTIKGFRGDQSKGNPYLHVLVDDLFIDTFSAASLELVEEPKPKEPKP